MAGQAMKWSLLFLCSCMVVPTTNDPAAWRQPWVESSRRERAAWVQHQAALACDPLMWPNAAPWPSQHPECPHTLDIPPQLMPPYSR